MSDVLTIAMPKGRIFEEAAELLRQAGFQLPPEFDDSRKLIIDVPEEKFRFILAKPMDVPTYVEHGVADLGIAGKDVMLEEERDVYELLDLKISAEHIAPADNSRHFHIIQASADDNFLIICVHKVRMDEIDIIFFKPF